MTSEQLTGKSMFYGDAPAPVPLVGRWLPPPLIGVIRRLRSEDPNWLWPPNSADLAQVLTRRCQGMGVDVPREVASAQFSAAQAWSAGRQFGCRLLLESKTGFQSALSLAGAWVLWARSLDDALGQPAVAVVGSRDASPYALAVAHRLGRDLAAAGLTVVSGLARGVDSAAHRGALEAGRTLAVFGSGLDCVYPREHRALADAIAANGGLFSEFPPGTPPRPAHFPQRNRIIAALAEAVVVVEASERSGSLSTARWALDLGRDVLVVPGQASGRNRGGHALIRDGAELVEDAEHVLAALSPEVHAALNAAHRRVQPSDGAQLASGLSELLRDGEVVDIEWLTVKLQLPVTRVLEQLGLFELQGRVSRVGPGRFVCLYRK